MIGAWMLTALLFSLFAALAAFSGEQVLRALGRPARAVWALAIAASLLWPVVAPPATESSPAQGMVVLPPIRVTQLVPAALEQSRTTWMPDVDRILLFAWAAASLVMVLRVGIGVRSARRVRRAAERRELSGVPLLVSEATGPAVIGLLRPEIVYPRGLLDLEPSLRDVIIRHEDEHRRARDAWLSFGCAIAVVLVPWNAALWWMTRRARLALEIDCDARVLRAHGNAAQYGKLLLLVAQTEADLSLAPALVSSRSHLERRIYAMLHRKPSHRLFRIALGTCGVVLASITACSAHVTSETPAVVPRPDLVAKLRSRIEAIGLSPDEIRDRLKSNGYPEAMLDPYLSGMPNAAAELTRRTTPVAMPNALPVDTGAVRAADSGKVFFEFQVEQQVRQLPGMRITYPADLKAAGQEGEVLAQFVVDTMGHVEPESFKVLVATNDAFVRAVREALPELRFFPAQLRGRSVKQLVQQPFTFALSRAP